MKYFFIPIAKFIVTIILTIIWASMFIVGTIITLLWDFKFVNFGYSYGGSYSRINISPYWRENPNASYHNSYLKFKSYFHYIWNIE
jgi:hypothetical protein